MIDLTNNRYGKLLVVSFAYKDNRSKQYYNCKCDCGNEKVVQMNSLIQGHTKSCKYCNDPKHPLYKTWYNIQQRCYNNKSQNYYLYGARGITVCDEWLNDINVFYNDVGDKPSKQHSLERINNELGYFKENCRWATQKEQNNNKRNNVLVTYELETLTLSQWADRLNLPYTKLYWQIQKQKLSIANIL